MRVSSNLALSLPMVVVACRVLLSNPDVTASETPDASKIEGGADAFEGHDGGIRYCDRLALDAGVVAKFCEDFDTPLRDAGWKQVSRGGNVAMRVIDLLDSGNGQLEFRALELAATDAGVAQYELHLDKALDIVPSPQMTVAFDLYLNVEYKAASSATETTFNVGVARFPLNTAGSNALQVVLQQDQTGFAQVQFQQPAFIASGAPSLSFVPTRWTRIRMVVASTVSSSNLRTVQVETDGRLGGESFASATSSLATTAGLVLELGPQISNVAKSVPKVAAIYDNVLVTVP